MNVWIGVAQSRQIWRWRRWGICLVLLVDRKLVLKSAHTTGFACIVKFKWHGIASVVQYYCTNHSFYFFCIVGCGKTMEQEGLDLSMCILLPFSMFYLFQWNIVKLSREHEIIISSSTTHPPPPFFDHHQKTLHYIRIASLYFV